MDRRRKMMKKRRRKQKLSEDGMLPDPKTETEWPPGTKLIFKEGTAAIAGRWKPGDEGEAPPRFEEQP